MAAVEHRLEDEIPKRAHLWQPKWDLFLSLRACAKPAEKPSERVGVRQLVRIHPQPAPVGPRKPLISQESTPAGPQNGSACVEEEREPTLMYLTGEEEREKKASQDVVQTARFLEGKWKECLKTRLLLLSSLETCHAKQIPQFLRRAYRSSQLGFREQVSAEFAHSITRVSPDAAGSRQRVNDGPQNSL
ncbi:hypothetical protein Bbelb_184980 [Branchiostoma belcheri]|nr:hypothetical protein Bbelb_184980 [Branchiostoma belcheri]